MAKKAKKKLRGFKKNAEAIAKRQGVSEKSGAKILASATRDASKAAKAKNPRLKRVKMAKKGGRKK